MAVRRPVRPRIILRTAFLVFLAGLILYFTFLSGLRPSSIADVKSDIEPFGVWAPIAAILLHIFGVVMLIPGVLLIIPTALIFGLDSIWISLIGQTAGSLAAYGIARYLGRDILHTILGQRMIAIERLLEERGFHYLLYLRLVAVVPLPMVAYGPGLVRVPIGQVTLATVLGQAPYIVILAFFGDSLAAIRRPGDLLAPGVYLPILLLFVLLALPLLGSAIVQRRRRRAAPPARDPEPPKAPKSSPSPSSAKKAPRPRRPRA